MSPDSPWGISPISSSLSYFDKIHFNLTAFYSGVFESIPLLSHPLLPSLSLQVRERLRVALERVSQLEDELTTSKEEVWLNLLWILSSPYLQLKTETSWVWKWKEFSDINEGERETGILQSPTYLTLELCFIFCIKKIFKWDRKLWENFLPPLLILLLIMLGQDPFPLQMMKGGGDRN